MGMTVPRRTDERPLEDVFQPLLGRFPWYMDVPLDEARVLMDQLLDTDGGRFPRGSSFVIDANAPSGLRRVWLSDVSKTRLEDSPQ